MNKKFEILDHPADLKIKAFGKDLPDVFVNAALAVAQQQAPEIKKFYPERSRRVGNLEIEEIVVESDNLNSLLVDWLSEILYRSEINKKVYADFEITEFSENPYKPPHLCKHGKRGTKYMPFRCGGKIKVKIKGVPVEQKNIDIKAVTYHDLEIKKVDGHWEAIVVFDI